MKIRILSIFLAFLLLICSGCSRNTAGSTLDRSEQAENELRESGGHDSVETTKLVNGESWHLAQRTIDLPKNMQTVTAQCVDGERIYIGGYTGTGVALCKIDIDGNVLLEYSLPEEISDIYAITIYQKALYCLVNLTQSTVTSDSQINSIQVITFSEQGVAGEKVVLPKECQASFPYKQLIVDENEYYLLADTTAFKVNRNDLAATCIYQDSPQDGSLAQESFFAMTLFGNKLLLLSNARFSRNCRILCVDTYGLSVDEIYTLHEQPLYSFGKMLDGRPIISHSNKGTAQMSILDIDSCCFNILMRWEDVGAPIQMTWVEETDFGYVFFQQNEHRIQSLQWVPGEKENVITLRLAGIGIPEIDEYVKEFNASQSVYKIEATYYSENSIDAYIGTSYFEYQPLDLLRTQIMAGDGPDIIFSSYGQSAADYLNDELCVDLVPYLNNDKTYNIDSFSPNLIDGMQKGDALYAIPLAFSIHTLVTDSKYTSTEGITLQEFREIRERYADVPAFSYFMKPADLLNESVQLICAAMVNMENGTCDFKNEEFYNYLRWIKTYTDTNQRAPSEFDNAMFEPCTINSLELFASLPDYPNQQLDSLIFIGYPMQSSYGSTMVLEASLGINKQSVCIDGAWQFIHFCLETLKSDSFSGIPAVQSLLNEEINAYRDGTKIDFLGRQLVIEPDNIKKIEALLQHTTFFAAQPQEIVQIIAEEASRYFSETTSEESVAEKIQSRVQLYLAEQS